MNHITSLWHRIGWTLTGVFVTLVLAPATAHALPGATTPSPTPGASTNPAEVFVNGQSSSTEFNNILSEVGGITRGFAAAVGAWLLYTGIKGLGSKIGSWKARTKIGAGSLLFLYAAAPQLLLSIFMSVAGFINRMLGR
jgi:hypothetical protein